MIFVGAVLGEMLQNKNTVTVLIVPLLALLEDHVNTLMKVNQRKKKDDITR